MIYLKLLPWAALVVLGALSWGLWSRLDSVTGQLDQAKATIETEHANERIVTKYVDKIIQVPGPAVIRDRIVRGVCSTIDLPSPGTADEAATADALARRDHEADRASESLRNAALNQAQCGALLEVLRPQVRQ